MKYKILKLIEINLIQTLFLCPLCKSDKWLHISSQLLQCNHCNNTFLKEKCIRHILKPVLNGYLNTCHQLKLIKFIKKKEKMILDSKY